MAVKPTRAAGIAVLALHYQNEVLHPDGKIRFGFAEGAGGRQSVVAAAKCVVAAARAAHVPVISVRIAFRPDYRDVIQNCDIFRRVVAAGAMKEGSWGAAFHAGLRPKPGELVVLHKRNNAFYGSELDDLVRGLGARRLVMMGVATNYVVEATARHAADIGYEVVIVRDACSARTAAAHKASLDALAVLAEIVTARDLAQQLRASTGSRSRRALPRSPDRRAAA